MPRSIDTTPEQGLARICTLMHGLVELDLVGRLKTVIGDLARGAKRRVCLSYEGRYGMLGRRPTACSMVGLICRLVCATSTLAT